MLQSEIVALHFALHVASVMGEKCGVIEATDPQAVLAMMAMAKAFVGMKLSAARVANPRADCKIKPAYR